MTLKGRPLVIGWPIGRSNQAACLNFDWKIGPHSIPISGNKLVPAAPHNSWVGVGGRVWSTDKDDRER
jgi:hypothetical protein